MPSINFGISSYERAEGDLPALPVINMYAEEAPTEETQVCLQSRHGLASRAGTLGVGPVQQLYQQDGVFDNSLFAVSNNTLYRDGVSLGPMDGTGPWSIAGYENFIFAAGGKRLWGYDGGTLTAIAFPDGADVAKVLVAASRLVAIRKDTGKFYWSKVLETSIDALDFATAENQPDKLLDMLFIDDVLMLYGAETVEFWPNNNDNPPFFPLEGRVIEKGIRGTGCAVGIGSTFAWVTNLNEVCMGDENGILSNPGLQVKIQQSANVKLFTFLLDGTEMLALRLDNETQVFSMRSKLWSEFSSYNLPNWLAQCHTQGVFGSAYDGQTFRWDDGYADPSGILERRFRAGYSMDGGGVNVSNLRLRCNVGQTAYLTTHNAEPIVEMRRSFDAGQTWGPWRQTSLGRQGAYRTQPEWRALGMVSYPGFLVEFRVTDDVGWRVSDVRLNEPRGGR